LIVSLAVTLVSSVGAQPADAPKAGSPSVKMLFDFEDGKNAGFEGGKATTDNAQSGKYSLLADKTFLRLDKAQDWSGYDLLKMDVFNPQEEPTMLLIEVRDAETKEYWTRVNYHTIIPPGKSTVTMPADQYVGEKSRPGRPLLKSKVRVLAIAPDKYPLIFDDIRLERLDTEKVQFEGLKAFDFGTKDSPVMPGYKGVDAATPYNSDRGYGWGRSNSYLTAFDGRQPDALFQDYVATGDASFQVDLPNGKYQVMMNIDSPGGYWGEVQHYSTRTVSVNGSTKVDEKQTLDQFKKRYFRNAHREDLPGIDTFKEYIEPTFNVKKFDIDVTDGKAVFEFKGDGLWPIALSTLVIYPIDKTDAGAKFWEWTTTQRRAQFQDYFKQITPKRAGAQAPKEGFTLFARSFMTPPNAYDGPQEKDAIPAEGLALSVANGEEGALSFSVQPSGDIGTIDVKISNLEFAGAQDKSTPPLKPETMQVGWLDYRLTRVTMDGTVYKSAPRYWKALPAPASNVTRTFLLRVRTPQNAKPGTYAGHITVKPANQPEKQIPVRLTVLPFTLAEITDVAAGPWGCSIGLPWPGTDKETQKWHADMLDNSMRVIREAGCTTLTGLPHIGLKAADGKVTLDFTQADAEMKQLRSHGFNHMINSYGQGLAYPMYGSANGPDEVFAKKAGFADMESFLKAVYSQIEEHAAANKWLPIAWNLCDEPLGAAAKASAKNAALHEKVAKELNLKYSIFTGATSMEGNDPKDPHYDLVKSLRMPSLNLHDEASIKVIQDDGHQFSFYNGGNRWTFGRYMKTLVVKYGMAYRTTWHFNVVAGDPYNALDCREDDYCWFNTDENKSLIPSMQILGDIQPGLNDYRYLSTLERLLKAKPNAAATAEAKKVYDEQVNLIAGKDRPKPSVEKLEADRALVVKTILSLLESK
jgi:hypothetical protein